MAEPKIFTKNYVNADSPVTASFGQASAANLFDRDRASKWQSSGANDDDQGIGIVVEFYEGATPVSRTIDTLMLLNHNLRHWALFAWDGSSWTLMTSDAATVDSDTFASFTPYTTTKILLEADDTQVADAEKFIGELVVCALTLNVGRDLDSYEQKYRERSRELQLGDGGIHKQVTRWAQNRTQRYEARVGFRFVNEADRATLKALREVGEPFLWQPESTYRPTEIYLVHWSSPWSERYETGYKGSGIQVQLELREV